MAIQMIRRHIQRRANVRAKGIGGFQLKARKLQHVPLPGREVFTSDAGGVPMFPPTCAGMPLCLRIWPVSAVVVVFPLAPVMPMISPCEVPARQFQIADHRHAAPPGSFENIQIGGNTGR